MKKLAILSALIAAGATHGQNILTFAANVADGETFTIGTDVFEFTADNTPTAGRRDQRGHRLFGRRGGHQRGGFP
jgi:hypothetical protein